MASGPSSPSPSPLPFSTASLCTASGGLWSPKQTGPFSGSRTFHTITVAGASLSPVTDSFISAKQWVWKDWGPMWGGWGSQGTSRKPLFLDALGRAGLCPYLELLFMSQLHPHPGTGHGDCRFDQRLQNPGQVQMPGGSKASFPL